MIRGVLFDYGGTLFEETGDESPLALACSEALAAFLSPRTGRAEAERIASAYLGVRREARHLAVQTDLEVDALTSLRGALARFHLAHEWSERTLREAVDAFFEPEAERHGPLPGALEALLALRAEGFLLGLVSNNTWGPFVRGMLLRHGFLPLLDPVVHSSETGFRKPHPAIFQIALRRWNLDPGEVVMVGDTVSRDVLGAHRAGMRAIRLTIHPDRDPADDLPQAIPDAEAATLAEVVSILRGWRAA